MKLLVVHGAPGVGKLTVAARLVECTGFRLLHYHALGRLFGPLFGYGTSAFADLRDRFYAEVIREARARGLSGVVSTFVFEPTVPLDWLQALWTEVEAHVFCVGLTCDIDEHRRRVESRDRGSLGGIGDFDVLREHLLDRTFAFPKLPCDQIVIDTTRMTVESVVETALDALPEGWRAP